MIRSLIGRLASRLYLWVDKRKGRRHFKEKIECNEGRTTIILSSVEGYRLTIVISKEAFVESFSCTKLRAVKHAVYSVMATASENAPEVLKLAVSRPITFPPLLPFFVGEEAQVQRVVRSYVEIITRRVTAQRKK